MTALSKDVMKLSPLQASARPSGHADARRWVHSVYSVNHHAPPNLSLHSFSIEGLQ